MLNFFKQILRRLYLFFTFKARMEPPEVGLAPIVQDTREDKWFTTANNLMDGHWKEPVIDNGNFSRYKWPIEEEHMGFMVLAENTEDLTGKVQRIESGDTLGFYTIEEFRSKFGALDYEEPLNVFHDDVTFIKGKGVMLPPNYNDNKTYTLG